MSLEGQHLGEFEVLERLGQGGMGDVYKARQSVLRRMVAIKTLRPALALDAEFITRFHNEAVAAAALNHPNLVQVYAAGQSQGQHWFAMEFVDGESVQKRLERLLRLTAEEALAICLHVAGALEYGWKKANLIHRDIKPDNIFLSNDGEVKLGDLGLAKSASQEISLTMTGASMGTPLYISPEQTEGRRDIDLRSDIYSLGCTLYHLLCGAPPYTGNSAVSVMIKHVSAPVPNLHALHPELHPTLAAVVSKMMQKAPADRHQNYAELTADLHAAYNALLILHPVDEEESIPVATLAPSAVARTGKQRTGSTRPTDGATKGGKPNPTAWIAGGCALALLLGGGLWLLLSKRDASPQKPESAPTTAAAALSTPAGPPKASLPKDSAQAAKTNPGNWLVLFDGKDMNRWRGPNENDPPPMGWEIKDGTLHAEKNNPFLISKDSFDSFKLELEWRVGKDTNSGIFYWVATGGEYTVNQAPEFQIHDITQKDVFKTGSLWGFIKVDQPADKPVGEWNTARIWIKGGKVEHWVNGQKVCAFDMDSPEWKQSPGKTKKFSSHRKGYIALQAQAGDVSYRNIRIRSL